MSIRQTAKLGIAVAAVALLAGVLPPGQTTAAADAKGWSLADTKVVQSNTSDKSVSVKKTGNGWTITSTPQAPQGAGLPKQDWTLTATFDFGNLPAKLKPGEVVTLKVSGEMSAVNLKIPMSSTVVASIGVVKAGSPDLVKLPNGQQWHTMEGTPPGPITDSFSFTFVVPEVGGDDLGIEIRGGPWGDTGVRWTYQDEVFTAFDEDPFAIFDKEFEAAGCPPVPAGSEGKMVAKVKSVAAPAYVNMGTGWLALQPGQELHLGEKVRTGENGFIIIEFFVKGDETGEHMVDVLPNTAFCISDISSALKLPEPGMVKTLINLVSGTLQAIAKGWSNGSIFSVKAGTSVCGIRGTDVLIDYQPTQERLVVNLKEGLVTVQSGTGEVSLQPGQRVEVLKGAIQPTGSIDTVTYDKAVRDIADAVNRSTAAGPPAFVLLGIAVLMVLVIAGILWVRRRRGRTV